MTTFQKLNLKDQKQILVLNAPESFESELKTLRGVGISPDIQRDLKSAGQIEFSLAFVTKQKEVDTLGKAIAKKVEGDAASGSLTPRAAPRDTNPRSTGMQAGKFSAKRASNQSGWSRSMRIGRLYDFGAWNLLRR